MHVLRIFAALRDERKVPGVWRDLSECDYTKRTGRCAGNINSSQQHLECIECSDIIFRMSPPVLVGKTVSQSCINDQTSIVFPQDLNPVGTLFGGRVMELGDRLAGVVAKRHAGHFCVTLGIDSVRFLAPARHGDILVFKSACNRVWRTSMEIGLKVFADDCKTMDRRHIVSAYFTFVGVDDDLNPIALPPLIAESYEEKRRYEDAETRRSARMTI